MILFYKRKENIRGMKEKFLRLLNEYENERNKIMNKIAKVDDNEDLTIEGKKKQKELLQSNFHKVEEKYAKLLNDILDQAITAVQENNKAEMKRRLSDTSYQVGLSNIIKGIELGAYDEMALHEIVNNNYIEDMYALKLINGAINKSGVAIPRFLEEDRVKKTIDYLNREKEQVEDYVENGLGNRSTRFGIMGMNDFIGEKFDGGLKYIG